MQKYLVRMSFKSKLTGKTVYRDIPVASDGKEYAEAAAVDFVMSDPSIRPTTAKEIKMRTYVMVLPREG